MTEIRLFLPAQFDQAEDLHCLNFSQMCVSFLVGKPERPILFCSIM